MENTKETLVKESLSKELLERWRASVESDKDLLGWELQGVPGKALYTSLPDVSVGAVGEILDFKMISPEHTYSGEEIDAGLIPEVSRVADLPAEVGTLKEIVFSRQYHGFEVLQEAAKLCLDKNIGLKLNIDPYLFPLTQGLVIKDVDEFWTKISQLILLNPQVRALSLGGGFLHMGGANAVQELGISLSAAWLSYQQLVNYGLKPKDAARQIGFELSVTTDQFMSIAKVSN